VRELVAVEVSAERPLLRGAQAFGFRALQPLVRALKQQSPSVAPRYDYLELMACPGGCTNGGGQLALSSTTDTPEQRLAMVDALYSAAPTHTPSLQDAETSAVYARLLDHGALLRTRYEEKEKEVTSNDKAGCACSTKQQHGDKAF